MRNGATREDLQNDLRRSLLTVTSTEADADTMRKLRSVRRNLTSPEKAPTASLRRQKHNIGTPPSTSDEEFGDAAAAPSASNDGPATLAAIVSLLEVKLNPVAASIHGLQTEFVGIRVSVEERLRATELRINAADVRIEKLAKFLEDGLAPPTCDGKLAEQIKNMEAHIAALKQGSSHTEATDRECTAVLGGLTALVDEDKAATWLTDKLASLSGPKPRDIFTKGDEFRGIIFAKFADKSQRDDAVSVLRRARCPQDGKDAWAKPDLPFEEGTMRHLVFGEARHDELGLRQGRSLGRPRERDTVPRRRESDVRHGREQSAEDRLRHGMARVLERRRGAPRMQDAAPEHPGQARQDAQQGQGEDEGQRGVGTAPVESRFTRHP